MFPVAYRHLIFCLPLDTAFALEGRFYGLIFAFGLGGKVILEGKVFPYVSFCPVKACKYFLSFYFLRVFGVTLMGALDTERPHMGGLFCFTCQRVRHVCKGQCVFACGAGNNHVHGRVGHAFDTRQA